MAKANRTCFFCGRGYNYCPTCRDDIKKPSWYSIWCSEQCKNLDNIVAAHRGGKITTEEAQKRIKELDAKDIRFARETLRDYFNKIMSYKVDVVEEVEESKNETENVDIVKTDNAITKSAKTASRKAKVVTASKTKVKEVESNEEDSAKGK